MLETGVFILPYDHETEAGEIGRPDVVGFKREDQP